MSNIQELIKQSNYDSLKKMYEIDNIEDYREWYINEFGKNISIGMFLCNSMEEFREWVVQESDNHFMKYIRILQKVEKSGVGYMTNFPISENRELFGGYRFEDDEELTGYHFRLYDDYGRLFGIIYIGDEDSEKVYAAKEAGIKIVTENEVDKILWECQLWNGTY